MRKLNSYLNVFLFFSITFLFTQSCIDDDSVTITGNVNLSESKFTIIDNSENSTTFNGLFQASDRSSVTVDGNGDFEISFTPSGSLTDFTYTYGVLRSTSTEIPIDIELGSEIDLGNLIVEEPIQVEFTVPNFEYVSEYYINFETFGENGFVANTDGSSEVGGVLRGYLYENQLNSVVVSQRKSDGELVSETYEYNAGDVTTDEVIELK